MNKFDEEAIAELRQIAIDEPWTPFDGMIPENHKARFIFDGHYVQVQLTYSCFAPSGHGAKGYMFSCMELEPDCSAPASTALPEEIANRLADLFLPSAGRRANMPSQMHPGKNRIFLQLMD